MVQVPTEVEGNITPRHPSNRLIMNFLKGQILDNFKIFRNKIIIILITTNILEIEIQWATIINSPNICINRDPINPLVIRLETPLRNKPITNLITMDTIKTMFKDPHIYNNELCCITFVSLI